MNKCGWRETESGGEKEKWHEDLEERVLAQTEESEGSFLKEGNLLAILGRGGS